MSANGANFQTRKRDNKMSVPVNSFSLNRVQKWFNETFEIVYSKVCRLFDFAVHVLDNEAATDPSHGDGV